MQRRKDKSDTDEFLSDLEKELPSFFTRQTVCRYIGGLYTPKYLANLDAKGLGPMKKCYIGKKVCYERNDFLDWLSSNMKRDNSK